MSTSSVELLHFENEPPLRPYFVGSFPLRGIYYFLTTPVLWRIVICPVIITLVAVILAIIAIFGGLLYPQYLAFHSIHGMPDWAAWIVAVALCIIEVFIVMLFVVMFFIDGTRRRVYKQVFIEEGVRIEEKSSFYEKKLNQMDGGCLAWIIADTVDGLKGYLCCFFKPDCFVEFLWMKVISFGLFIITLPLNLIPVLGTFVFTMMNGYYMAWRMQDGYLEKKGLSFNERKYFVSRRMSEFLSFGTVCMLLDIIPIVNVILIYSNIVASALWAVHMEKSGMFNRMTRNKEDDQMPFVFEEQEEEAITPELSPNHHSFNDVRTGSSSDQEVNLLTTKDVNGIKVTYF